MKRKIVMMAAMVLSIGCMAVPVAASENLAVPAEIAAEASVTSPNCPECGYPGKIVDQIITDYYTMVYCNCEDHGLYHYYVWH